MGIEEGFDDDEAHPQPCEGAVEVVIFRAGLVFSHAVVAHPVVADLAAAPVAASEACEEPRAPVFGRVGGDVEGYLGGLVVLAGAGAAGAGAADDREAARAGQARFEGLEGVNAYGAFIEASVGDVGFFDVGKKGVPSALRRAAW